MGSSKAQIGFEVAWVMIVLVIVAIGLISAYVAVKDLNDDIQADPDISQDAKDASANLADNYASNWDGVMFFFFILLWIFLVISAFFSSTQPVFMVISIIMIVFGLVVVMILSNAYEETTDDPGLSSFAAEFPKMNWILDHALIVMMLMGLSVLLVLYGRK